jgi:putative ABC transport system ATP-binding protein
VGLGDRLDAHPHELSGGQRQRVAIARALIANPELVLADEPTASLDKKSGRGVVELLQKLAKRDGVTVILVTHDNRILDIADRIITLEDGRLSSLMSAVTSDTHHMLEMIARDLRGGNLASRMTVLNRDEFTELMGEITSETQGLLDIVDLVQGETFRSVQEQVISAFTGKIGEFLDAEDATLYFLDMDTQALWSFEQTSRGDFEEINISPERGIVGYVARTGNTVSTTDAASLDQYDQFIDGESTKSLLCMPVLDSEGRIFAVLSLANKGNGEPFNTDDEQQIREFTNTLALVLESWWRMGCSCRAAGIGREASCCAP